MKKIDVACFQLCSSESVEKNIATIDRMFDSIEKKLDLVCLPECAAIFTESKKKLNAYSDNWHEKFVNFIKDRAKKNKTDILIGSIPYRKKNLKFLNKVINKKVQTLTYYGFQKKFFQKFFNNNLLEGIDRVVPIGQALNLDLVWDGYDLNKTLTRIIDIR